MTGQTAPNHQQAPRSRPRVTAEHLTADALTDAIEVLQTKAVSTFGINFKVRATGTQFRLAPLRDPHQPRLWCVSVRQFSPSGSQAGSAHVWIDRPGRSRTEVAELIETIRNDIGAWLSAPARRDLCRWLLTTAPEPPPSFAISLT